MKFTKPVTGQARFVRILNCVLGLPRMSTSREAFQAQKLNGRRSWQALGGWGEVAIPGPRSGFWTLGPDFGLGTSKRAAALRRDVLMACSVALLQV